MAFPLVIKGGNNLFIYIMPFTHAPNLFVTQGKRVSSQVSSETG